MIFGPEDNDDMEDYDDENEEDPDDIWTDDLVDR
jgi:hypothetical protein